MIEGNRELILESLGTTSQDTAKQLEDLLKRQELAWQLGNPIEAERLATELPVSSHREEMLLALICNEVVLREQTGMQPQLLEYQQRFPELAEVLRIQWEVDRWLTAGPDATWTMGLRRGEGGSTSRSASGTNSELRSASLGQCGAEAKRFGRYELQREVGRGAAGVVYEAWDPLLKRSVALKRMRSGIDADEHEIRRIETEAEAIAKIHHENIVQIYDVGKQFGQPFLAMEFCHGGSLAERLNGTPLTARLAAELVTKIAAAVAKAHECQIVHRDLKPSNVLLDSAGEWCPKVTDFGLAKRLDGADGATATGSILGTPAYMAPEQAFGGSKHVGPAADIYSLGAVLYECLTGRPPFRGATIADTLDQVRSQQPVPVCQLQPQVPRDLETIAHKCLRKEPHLRYASALELSGDLNRFLQGVPIRARRESYLEFAGRTFRRYPATSSLSAISILLLIAITIASTLFARSLDVERKKLLAAQKQTRLSEAKALLGQAQGIRQSRQPGQRFAALSAIRQAVAIGRELDQPPEWYMPARAEAIAAMLLPDAYFESLRQEQSEIHTADSSDDEQLVAIAFYSGYVSLRRSADHQELFRIEDAGKSTSVRFIGDDRLFLGRHDTGSYEMWDVTTSPPRKLWEQSSGFERFHCRSDHQVMAVACRKSIVVHDVLSGHRIATMPALPFSREPRAVLHPTQPIVLIHSYFNATIEFRNYLTGEVTYTFEPTTNSVEYPGYCGADWSPDGKALVFWGGHSEASYWYYFDSDTLKVNHTRTDRPPKAGGGGGETVRFSPSGDRLFLLGWSNRLSVADAISGREILRSYEIQHCQPFGEVKPSLSGASAGFFRDSENKLRIGTLSIADGLECYPLRPEGELSGEGYFAPCGRIVVVFHGDGFSVFDVADGRQLLKTELKDLHAQELSFDMVGNMIYSSALGFFQWPYRMLDADLKRIVFDSPQRIAFPEGRLFTAVDNLGQNLAAGAWNGLGTQEYAGSWLKVPDDAASRKIIGGGSGVCIALHPSGDFAILDAGNGVAKVFTLRGKVEEVHHLGPSNVNQFSRDGKWLLAAGKRWTVGRWSESVDLGTGTPFGLSIDGQVAYVQLNSGKIRIVNANSGADLASIEGLELTGISRLSPDDSKLLCSTKSGFVICDLRRIRAGLTEMGLDWEAPPILGPREPPVRIESASLAPELQSLKTANELADFVDNRAFARALFDPADPDKCFAAATVAIHRRQLILAHALMNWICWLQPEATGVRRWRACLLADMGQLEAASRDAQWILMHIEDRDLRLISADWLYQQDRFDEALAVMAKLGDDGPRSPLMLALRSLCHRALGNFQQAEADFAVFESKLSTHLDSLDMTVRPMVGRDISLRCPTVALQVAERMQKLQSDYSTEYGNTIALAYCRAGRFREAIDLLKPAFEKQDPISLGFDLYVLARCHSRLGEVIQARSAFAAAEQWLGTTKELTGFDRLELRALRFEAQRAIGLWAEWSCMIQPVKD